MATTRDLFPTLPAEIRNTVYSYTNVTTASATTNGIPFTIKRYTNKSTTITIIPVHHGSPGLLSLRNYKYLEGEEYRAWLLTHGTTLRISIHFHGRSTTFIQEHWDTQIQRHLAKLTREHKWLKKVATYEIQILWDDKDVVLTSRKRVAGQIPGSMVDTIVSALGTEEILRVKGDVEVGLNVPDWVVNGYVGSGREFGYRKFLEMDDTTGKIRKQTREIKIVPSNRGIGGSGVAVAETVCNAPGFAAIPGTGDCAKQKDKDLLEADDEKLRGNWMECTQGDVLVRKWVCGGNNGRDAEESGIQVATAKETRVGERVAWPVLAEVLGGTAPPKRS